MQATDLTVPFGVATYKLNYHSPSSNREGLKERIAKAAHTDVWCLQGVNLSRQLKTLPDTHAAVFHSGLAFVYNTARVQLINKECINLAGSLLDAAGERAAVADAFRVSRFHLSKLKLFVSFGAFELADRISTTSPPVVHAATRSLLVVNVDFEKYREWGSAFHCALLRVLCRLIWEGNGCFTRRWDCTHVCIAGSFFFSPGSTPYTALTSFSGGCVLDVPAQLIVAPFKVISLSDEREEEQQKKDIVATAVTPSVVRSCVAAVPVEDVNSCRQLLGVRLSSTLQCSNSNEEGGLLERAPAAAPPRSLPESLRLWYFNHATGTYEAEESVIAVDDGWWMLQTPRDTSASDTVVVRLEWKSVCGTVAAAAEPRAARVKVELRVRSFGVLTPQRQDADGLSVGEALLCSATAQTCSAAAAAQFAQTLEQRGLSPAHVAKLCSVECRAFGEPAVTALYREGAAELSGCHDYVFVSSFTGARVQEAATFTLADFDRETATAHLPVSCTVAVPCVAR